MAEYVQLGALKTWYGKHGSGDPLVLMHGDLVDSRFFEPNLGALAERFHVYTPERRGRGHSPDLPGPITYQLMADDTIAFLEAVVGEPADLVGHSDGAFVAMLVAMQRPELVKPLVMISGGFNKSGEAAPDMGVERRRAGAVPRARVRRGVPGRRGPLQGGCDQGRRGWLPSSRTCRRPTLPRCRSGRS